MDNHQETNFDNPKNQKNDKHHLFKKSLSQYMRLGLEAVLTTFNRFPLTLLFFFAIAIIIIYRIEMPYERLKDINELLDRLIAVLSLGITLSLSVTMLLENFRTQANLLLRLASYLGEAIILYFYYLLLFPNTEQVAVTRLLLIIGTLLLCFFFIPYLKKKENLEIYITKLITNFAATAFYTIVLCLGIMAILFAIENLLYGNMNNDLYAETWIVGWLVFAPLNFFHGLPHAKDTFTVEHFNKVIKAMLLYILLPVITAYTLVLYIYFAKIIITQVWPKGIVSYLVVSYAAVGTLAIFLTAPFKNAVKWVKIFSAYFIKLIFPLLVMMFIAIFIRIGEFGFTENRYFIVVIGIWSVFAMLFLNFYKGKNSTILPISLAIIAFLTVIGPWNAFQTSINSQNQRFYEIAAKYDMIENGKVVENTKTVAENDQKEINAIIHYFDSAHQLTDLKYLPEDFDINKFEDIFGFPESYGYDSWMENYFSYYRESSRSLDISGYDLLLPLEGPRYDSIDNIIIDQEAVYGTDTFKIAMDNKFTFSISKNGQEIYREDFNDYIKGLYDKYGSNMNKDRSEESADFDQDMIFTKEVDSIKVMFVFTNINGYYDSANDEITVEGISGDIFLSYK